MKRFIWFIAMAWAALCSSPAGAVTLQVQSLWLDAPRYSIGANVTATVKVTSPSAVVVPQLVVMARDEAGNNYDFPLYNNVSVGTQTTTVTYSKVFTHPRRYLVQLAYRDEAGWHNVGPSIDFTVRPKSGVYPGWPASYDQFDAFAAFRSRRVERPATYLDGKSWDIIGTPSYFTYNYGSASSTGAKYGPDFLVSVPMLPFISGVSIDAGAQGAYDTWWVKLATTLKNGGLGNVIIRPGWEANSPGNYPWSAANGKEATYAAYFRHIVNAMRSVPGTSFKFDLCVTVAVDGERGANLALMWPGDEYVDYLGLDLYDMYPGGYLDAASRWNWYLTAKSGLKDLAGFAAAHGKWMSFDEWALASPSWNGGGDSSYFIYQMYYWMISHDVAFEVYNNTRYDQPPTDGRIDIGLYPQAAVAYKSLFGGY